MKKNLIVLVMLVSSLAFAKTIDLKSLLDSLPKDKVSRFEPMKISPPFPFNAKERKYNLYVISDSDEVVQTTVFLAVRKGSRHVYKLGIILPVGTTSNDASRYALGYVSSFFVTACFGSDVHSDMTTWITNKLDLAKERSEGDFQKTFGSIRVNAGFGPLGFSAQAFTRDGKPWSNTCSLERV